MNQINKVRINLHGHLKTDVAEFFELFVESAAEAIHAINTLTNGKLYKSLDNNKNREYRVLINDEDIISEKPLNKIENADSLATSSLAIKGCIKQIDIIPMIEFGDSGTIATVLGALLIVVGVVLLIIPGFNALGVAAIMIGLGLLAAGITAMLSKPPQFEDFREINQGGRFSYLFNGPQNTSREGGPVPVGYGRLLIGSQTVSASYDISQFLTSGAPIPSGVIGGSATLPTEPSY